MEIKLALGGRRRSPGTVAVYFLLVAVLLLLVLTDATVASPSTKPAVSPDDGNADATRRGSSSRWLWQQGHHGPAPARRLLLAVQPATTAIVGKDTNKFYVEGVHRPANGKPDREVEFNAGRKRIPGSGSNRNHN